nr:NAD-dependent deacylase [Deinobacterium chartae]
MRAARDRLRRAARVAVLTGAGVSKESGIPTFREAQTGLWARFSPEELASPQAYRRDPEQVWRWYAERYRNCIRAEPNRAHRLLADLEMRRPEALLLVTQNVDGLHARAGSQRVQELHGNLTQARCERCQRTAPLGDPDTLELPPPCPHCGSPMRPNVVWFGENLPSSALEAAYVAFLEAEVALVIGTSGVVEPAASLARLTAQQGGLVIEINPEATPLSAYANLSLRTGASEGLSRLLDD